MSLQIDITGDNLDLTHELKQHVHAKFNKIEHKFQNITKIHVILTVENGFQHKAEAVMHLAGGKRGGDIFAHADSKDMYTSITDLSKKLQTQVLEHKDKLKDHGKG